MAIKFGTSGWRGVISEDFTFGNVRKVAAAVTGHVLENPEFGERSPEFRATQGHGRLGSPLVVVGYDTRFLSDDFAKETAEVMTAGGLTVQVAASDVPTPCLAHAILDRKAIGGVVITASHNPFQYNGFKWAPYWAGPAIPAITEDLERRTGAILANPPGVKFDEAVKDGRIKVEDFIPPYKKHLLGLLDRKAFSKTRLRVGVDCLHGTARRVLRPMLEDLGCEVVALREDRDVLFGGIHPEPTAETLAGLQDLMKKKRLDIGLACDCDADRFGIIDPEAGYIQPNEFLGLALHHLTVNRGMKGRVARSLMTSHFIDAVAKSGGLDVKETPVGFKYIGDLLRGGEFLIGGEESGGMSIRGHVPEKDGILACLLAAELRAVERRTLGKVLKDLYKKVGGFANARLNFKMEHEESFNQIAVQLNVRPPLKLAGSSVWRIDTTDGFKFLMKDGSWMGMRPSGTEPAVRLYAEASDGKKLTKLLDEGKKILSGKF